MDADFEDQIGTALFFLEGAAADIRSFMNDYVGRRVDPRSAD